MSIAGTTPTGSTNKHNGNNSGNLHIGISYRNAPTHSSHPLKHQAPQSLYHHCQTIYNQPLRASWISPDDDDEDDDEDEVDTESGSETPPIKDNAAAVVGRYEALLDDEAITKSYLDPPCISSPPITTTTTLEKTKTSKLSQMKGRIQSTPFPVSATTTTITKSNKEDQGVNKDTLLTRTVETDAAIANRPSLSPLPTPPPSTTPRSPLPIGGSSSCSLNSRSSLAQRNMIMRTGSLSSLSYHHQQPISSVLSSTSTCSSSSVSSDPLFSAGTGSSSNSSNGETNDSCSPVPSSSSRLKLAFQKLRGRHFSSSTNNNEPKGPSLSDKSTSRKSTCSTITTKSSPTGPTPTKSTSLAKRIRSKFNKSKSTTTTTTTTNKRVSRATSLSSVTTWSYPEQQEQSHSFNRGDTTTQRPVSNQQDGSLRHNKHRIQHWPHQHYHHHHHHSHHHHRHNPRQQQHHNTLHHQQQRMMQPMPSMSSPPPSKGAIPRATSDMLLSSCSQQSSPMPLAASDTSVVRFARVVSVKETFSRYEYDRGSDPDAVCTRLTPAMAQYIKQELNMYKLNEMPVHEQSRVHTHFFL